jgi:hypothetical protein
MTIQRYPATPAGETAAFAVADPKNIMFEASGFTVRSGPDYIAPPAPTPDELDRAVARAYAKLTALKGMTPAQVQTWCEGNFPSLTLAEQRNIAAIGIAVGLLAREL